MSVAISKLQHIGCITALHLHPPHQPNRLLVASGSTLHVYTYPALHLHTSHQWHHHAHRIHGITSLGDILCIWGGRYAQLLSLTAATVTPYSQPLRLRDHVWNVACLICPDTCPSSSSSAPPHTFHLILGLAHNSVAVCTVPLPSAAVLLPVKLTVDGETACSVRSLLYSVSFHGTCLHDLHVVAGTVFSSIVVWTAHPTARITHTLTGHTGVIFHTCTSTSPSTSDASSSSTTSAPTAAAASSFLVHSVSDDRTVRSFSVQSDGCWQLLATGWGHEARVFRLATTAAGSLVSGGEDDTVRVWADGAETAIWRERGRKGGVWAVAVDEGSGRVVAGLGDGRVRVMDFSGVLCAHTQQHHLPNVRTQSTPSSHQQAVQQWDLSSFETAADEAPTVDLSLPPAKRKAAPAVDTNKDNFEKRKQAAAAPQADVEYCRAITHCTATNALLMATSSGRILHLTLPLSTDQSTTQQPTTALLFRYPPHLSINTLTVSSDGRLLAAGDSRGNLLLLALTGRGPSAAVSTECWCHRTAVCTTAISFVQFVTVLSVSYLMTADAVGEVRWWRIVDSVEQQRPSVELCEMSSFRLPLRTHVTCAMVMPVSQTSDVEESGTVEDEVEDEGEDEAEAEVDVVVVCSLSCSGVGAGVGRR